MYLQIALDQTNRLTFMTFFTGTVTNISIVVFLALKCNLLRIALSILVKYPRNIEKTLTNTSENPRQSVNESTKARSVGISGKAHQT